MSKRFLVSGFCVLIFFFASAQEVKVTGRFLQDSVRIGQPISFYLTAHYPSTTTILFPDSTFSFAPFEFQKKSFVPTSTKNGFSYDSVIYTLTTYEIDSLQFLQLPLFVVNEKDCVTVASNIDTLLFSRLVKNLPDTVQLAKVPLKTNTNYLSVSWLLNYPILLIIGAILLILLIVGWIIFGKRIKKYFKIKKLTKNHQTFLNQLNTSVDKLQSNFSPEATESALLIWKKYLENLISKPYTKYTTKEINEFEKDERMILSLAAIDRMIYANQPDRIDHFVNLKSYSEDQFFKKLEEIKNG
ncbi:MAG: hypothetical protein ORN54_16010 [Cyclobacteriaceae bacterium]|nr:hypothetical protein [Cyclobacteriaceae bacterium]